MATDDGEVFGEMLRRRRFAAGLTQEALAERAGLSARAISDLERGVKRWPYRDTVLRLAEVLPVAGAERERFLAAARRPTISRAPRVLARSSFGALPQPCTSLIGRAREMGEIVDALNGHVRLLTVTGPGGVGKTRVAIEAAAQLQPMFADGVVFVDLTPVTDAALVPATIAAALGLRQHDARSLVETLIAALAERRLLFLLDNCERVLAAASDLDRLLNGASGVAILATGRARLALRAEQEIILAPLEVPNPARLPELSALADIDSVQLFISRARAFNPDLALRRDNAAAVADICARLDGLPLAIELAATRAKILPPTALAQRLERRLPLLTGGPRDLPERQRTLRDTIAWSYNLLNRDEQTLLQRLSVFAGGFTIEAAERVGAMDKSTMSGDGAADTLDVVASLVDKSLLQQISRGGESRLAMLETVREFALEQLVANGLEQRARRAHADWYLAAAELAAPELRKESQQRWLDRLETELPNLREAIAWGLLTDGELALRLTVALHWFWYLRGSLAEGLLTSERALASGAEASASLRAQALNYASAFARGLGYAEQALAPAQQALALANELDNDGLLAYVRLNLGATLGMSGDEDCLIALVTEALDAFRRHDDMWGVGTCLGNLIGPALHRGDFDAARALAEESYRAFLSIGDRSDGVLAVLSLGAIARMQGDFAEAHERFADALATCRQLDNPLTMSQALLMLAEVVVDEGHLAEALDLVREGMSICQDMGDTAGFAVGLEILGSLAAAVGQFERATRLLAASEIRAPSPAGRWTMVNPDDRRRLRERCQAALTNASFERAYRDGAALPTSIVLPLALSNWEVLTASPAF